MPNAVIPTKKNGSKYCVKRKSAVILPLRKRPFPWLPINSKRLSLSCSCGYLAWHYFPYLPALRGFGVPAIAPFLFIAILRSLFFKMQASCGQLFANGA